MAHWPPVPEPLTEHPKNFSSSVQKALSKAITNAFRGPAGGNPITSPTIAVDRNGTTIASGFTETTGGGPSFVITPPTVDYTAPPAAVYSDTGWDMIAHYYDDWGRLGSSSAPWASYWPVWAGPNPYNNPFDLSRVAGLNKYQGDNAKVLGYIIGDLLWGGWNVLSAACENYDASTAANAADKYHNFYVLFNSVPNFTGGLMKLMPWLQASFSGGTTQAQFLARWKKTIDEISTPFPANRYIITDSGKTYLGFFVFNYNNLLGLGFSTYGDLSSYIVTNVVPLVQALGYDGMYLLAHGSVSDAQAWAPGGPGSGYEHLQSVGLKIDRGSYNALAFAGSRQESGAYYDLSGTSYNGLAASFPFGGVQPDTIGRRVLSVPCSAKSIPPHPSNFQQAGSTPGLFQVALQQAKDWMVANPLINGQRPRITCYNVSEWAEAGPGLMVNQKDGAGYLTAGKVVFPAIAATYTPLYKADFSTFSLGAQPIGVNGFSSNVPATGRFNTSTDFTDPLTAGQVLKLSITDFTTQQAFGGNMYDAPSPITLAEGQECWTRIFHRFPNGFPFGINPANLPIGNGDGASHVKILRFDGPGAVLREIFYFDNFGTPTLGTPPTNSCTIGFLDASTLSPPQSGDPAFPTQTVIDTTKWYCIEWYIKFSKTGNGVIQAWVDGVWCGSVTGINTIGSANTIQSLVYGNYKNGGFPANLSWYLANIIVTLQTPTARDSGGRPMIGTTAKVSDFP